MTEEDIKNAFGSKVYKFEDGIVELQKLFEGRGINTITNTKTGVIYFIVLDDLSIPNDSRIGEL